MHSHLSNPFSDELRRRPHVRRRHLRHWILVRRWSLLLYWPESQGPAHPARGGRAARGKLIRRVDQREEGPCGCALGFCLDLTFLGISASTSCTDVGLIDRAVAAKSCLVYSICLYTQMYTSHTFCKNRIRSFLK